MKQVNKKGVSEIVAIILIISVTMVGFFSVQNWYTGYVDNIETKKLQSLSGPSSESFEIISFEQTGSTSELKVRSFTPGYTILNDLKINGQECSLPHSNVILGNSLSTIEVSCPSYNSTNEIALITNFGILNYKQKLERESIVVVPDSIPDPFSFDTLNCDAYSNIVIVTGFNQPLTVNITNTSQYPYSYGLMVNGGDWVMSSEINSGDTLQIRISTLSTSSFRVRLGSYSTTVNVIGCG